MFVASITDANLHTNSEDQHSLIKEWRGPTLFPLLSALLLFPVRYTGAMYQAVKPLLFRLEPEQVHDWTMDGLSLVSRHDVALEALKRAYDRPDPRLRVRRFGLDFANPIGLAAGMDKNARALPAWAALGFGFVELGSVTAIAQPGNPKPRLVRLVGEQAIINRMGFNNDGAARVAARLRQLRASGRWPGVPVGVNIGKSKLAPLEDAPADYEASLKRLWPFGDYFVINVSSPNTPGLRSLQAHEPLALLLSTLRSFATRQSEDKPMLVKISPDLTFGQIGGILELARSYGVRGVIATNTTTERDMLSSAVDEPGGLSGGPLRARSLDVLRYVRSVVGAELPILSVGGVATVYDVVTRLRAGASLVQVYTALIYRGPGLVKTLNRGLLEYLQREGVGSVESLIGTDAAPVRR